MTIKLLHGAILCLFFFTLPDISIAQFTVFSENMGNTSVGTSQLSARTYNGFQNYGQSNISYSADMGSTTTVRSTTPSTYPGASAGNYVYINGNSSAYFGINNINISGATGLSISFGVSKTSLAENGSHLQLVITVDGGTQITYSPTLSTASGSTQWYYVTTNVTIPSGSIMNIRFNNTTDATNSASFRIDDIRVTATALPVAFGSINASHSKDQLNIQWSTLSETNNDHFDVEVSQNGKDFTKIATIKSKAIDGNSGVPLQYEFTSPVIVMSLAAISTFLAILVIGVGKSAKHVAILPISLLITILFISCQKGNIVQREVSNKIFVRVAQVDVDGTKSYSKIVKAVEE